MTRIAIIGTGSVGRALGGGLAGKVGASVVYGVRDPTESRHTDLSEVSAVSSACADADVVILAVPAPAVGDVVPTLGLQPGQHLVDATNAVRTPVPDGHDSVGSFVASLLPDGVSMAKAFNTIGAEFLGDGTIDGRPAFLPLAGDDVATDAVLPLAEGLGFAPVVVGGRDAFALVEAHARLWIQLAFGCGWGRDFGFVVAGR